VKRSIVTGVGFLLVAVVSIALVVRQAERDSADPARCGTLVSIGRRCCAIGQVERAGRCEGKPAMCPAPLRGTDAGCAAPLARVAIAGGTLRAGAGDWEAEGRVTAHEAQIAPFAIDAFEINEEAYGECVQAGRCPMVPLTGEPGRALGGLARPDVDAYCAFRGGRLPTDDEWTFAAAGAKSRRYPWGDTGAVCRRGAWGLDAGPCGFDFVAPEVGGAHPDGASPEGVHDLAGNVAEWVAGAPADRVGSVRGGSFRSALATELRAWQGRSVPVGERAADVGGRCAYDTTPAGAAEVTPAAIATPRLGDPRVP
jgi:formylglycine-generating enzyme required for sulfatase activity